MRSLSDGHVAVDALVAMLIVALSIILSLRAVQQAERTALMAREIRRANTLIAELMLEGPRSYIPSSGQTDGFQWNVETQTTGAERPIEVCRRVVQLTHRVSTRRYAASSLETCPPEPG